MAPSQPRFTKCPPGEALGARDLQNWSRRRAGGWSGAGKRDDWTTGEHDRFTKQPRNISCRKCGHSKIVEISDAKMKGARFRCSKCGARAKAKAFR